MNRKIVSAAMICLIVGLAACGDDRDRVAGSTDGAAIDYSDWCEQLDEFMVEFRNVMVAPSAPPTPQSEEGQAFERMVREFVELPVPEHIREDWALAMPRNPTPPETQDPVEQARARANTIEWILDNCELSEDVDSELRQQFADDREYLDGIPSTTT